MPSSVGTPEAPNNVGDDRAIARYPQPRDPPPCPLRAPRRLDGRGRGAVRQVGARGLARPGAARRGPAGDDAALRLAVPGPRGETARRLREVRPAAATPP